MKEKEKFVKTGDIAEYFGVTKRTIQRWIVERAMPAYRPGGTYLFYWSEVKEWMKGQKRE